MKVWVLMYTFWTGKIFLSFFCNFYDFLKKNLIFWKKYSFTQPLPQPNFTIGLGFLAIFQRPWVCQGLWKIEKPIKNCSRWSVEVWEYSFFQNPSFCQIGFSLNIAVVIHHNGPKCIRYEWILSLLCLDILWVLENMVWNHYFAVL